MASLATILASVTKFITASDKAHAIVNGPSTGAGSTVTVESGVIPTFAKKLAESGSNIIIRPDNLGNPNGRETLHVTGTYEGDTLDTTVIKLNESSAYPVWVRSGIEDVTIYDYTQKRLSLIHI